MFVESFGNGPDKFNVSVRFSFLLKGMGPVDVVVN